MEERVAFAGGALDLRTTTGQGTRLLATFPLDPNAIYAALPGDLVQ